MVNLLCEGDETSNGIGSVRDDGMKEFMLLFFIFVLRHSNSYGMLFYVAYGTILNFSAVRQRNLRFFP